MVFFEAVDKAILEDGFVVTTVRYANCGGAKTYHLYKETAAFVKDLNEYRPKTSITVHTAKCFDYIGPSNEHAHSIAADRLKRAHKDDNDDGIDLILINSEQNELDDSHYQFIDNHEDLQAWFERILHLQLRSPPGAGDNPYPIGPSAAPSNGMPQS